MILGIFSLAILAQAAPSSEVEKWIGPILTSVASLIATLFAYLSGRDKMIYDSDRRVEKMRLEALELESKQCKEDRLSLLKKYEKLDEEFDKLLRGISTSNAIEAADEELEVRSRRPKKPGSKTTTPKLDPDSQDGQQ